eukprot:m.386630 g.386630  ORF g.386630 m.386630 type:complete len:302 (+) comp21018_c1_seq8:178-1083(+)
MYVCWLPQPFVSSDIYVYVIMLYFADIAFGHTFKHARTPASNAIRWQLSIVWGGVKHASMSGKAAVVSALSGVFSVRHHATSALDRREVHYPCMSCWPTGNHPVFRWTLGWMTPPQVTFLKLPATKNIRWEMMNERVYQDIVLPLHTLETAISRAADLFGIWPLLVYPSRIYNHGKHAQGLFREPHPDSVVPGTNYGMYYDLGVYGIPREVRRKEPYDNVSTMRMMEEYTRCVGGAPFLYADTFMDRTEFSEMFDLRLYEHVRTKYGAALHFPHVYDKTSGCQSFDWRNKANTAPALKKST